MEEDSLNFGSDAAGGTPDANSILAQPPLQGESPQEGQGEGPAAEGMCHVCSLFDINATH